MFADTMTTVAHLPENASAVEEVLRMLTYKRRAGTKTEAEFIERFILPLSEHPNATDFTEDGFGNIYIEVCGGSKTLFTAHTDSVHAAGGMQEVLFDANLAVAYKGADNQALGADDAAGMFLLFELLRAGVPCWLAFFRAEEVGGQGSSFAAKQHADFFTQFDYAVSFDRKGSGDVITHQGWSRCCSDKFAKHLSDALNVFDLAYKPDDGGIFTDSANLTDLIPECTNLSVGYNHEHTNNEELDVDHLLMLRDAVIQIDWADMPVVRKAGEIDELDYGVYPGFGLDRYSKTTARSKPRMEYTVSDLCDMTVDELEDAMWDNPREMAEAVFELLWGDARPVEEDDHGVFVLSDSPLDYEEEDV